MQLVIEPDPKKYDILNERTNTVLCTENLVWHAQILSDRADFFSDGLGVFSGMIEKATVIWLDPVYKSGSPQARRLRCQSNSMTGFLMLLNHRSKKISSIGQYLGMPDKTLGAQHRVCQLIQYVIFF